MYEGYAMLRGAREAEQASAINSRQDHQSLFGDIPNLNVGESIETARD